MKKPALLIVVMVVTALGVGFWRDRYTQGEHHDAAIPKVLSLNGGTLLNPPKPLSNFDLVDMHNQNFTQNNLKNRWSFIFFGYSHCPDICPRSLKTLQRLSQHFLGAPQIQFIFVSINPTVDNPDKLKTFLQQFKFNQQIQLTGLTGSSPKVADFAKEFGLEFSATPFTNDISHSNIIFLTNPKGQLNAIFTSPKSYVIAQDLREIMHRSRLAGV